MNEINIYVNYNYKKVKIQANLFFNKNFNKFNAKTVFAPQEGTYSISLRKNNIRICYWEENTKHGQKNINTIKKFLTKVFKNHTIGFTFVGNTNILNSLSSIKKIRLQ